LRAQRSKAFWAAVERGTLLTRAGRLQQPFFITTKTGLLKRPDQVLGGDLRHDLAALVEPAPVVEAEGECEGVVDLVGFRGPERRWVVGPRRAKAGPSRPKLPRISD
jgi:hypothetical protein